MAESWRIHLLVVTSNGRRAYFTTYPSVRAASIRGTGAQDSSGARVPRELDPRHARPSTLTAVDARGPLPQAPVTGRVAMDPSRCGCGVAAKC
jgi:hypothetical protein